MGIRLLMGGVLLVGASCVCAQSDAPAQEARRQGSVALTPGVKQSPEQSMRQAIAFERFKEQAAAREEQKEERAAAGTGSKVTHTAAAARRRR